jgi:hypothetical protein
MKTFKNKILSSVLVLSLMTGAVVYPKNEANAGIVIGVAVPGVGSALVGLGIFFFSITVGVAMNLSHAMKGTLCFLDQDLNDESMNQIKTQLVKEYGMEDNLASVVIDYLKINSNNATVNPDGSKTIVLNSLQIEDVMGKAADAGITGSKAESLKYLLTHTPSESEIFQIQNALVESSR